MSDQIHLLVVYDVTNDRRRTRLAKALGYYLDRVQFSVFEGTMNPGRFPLLIDAIKLEIDPGEDNVRVYRLCKRCVGVAMVEGVATWIPGPEEDHIL